MSLIRMGKVIPLGNVTRLDLPPDKILKAAIGQMEGVVIIGYDKEGFHYFGSTYADGGEVLWLLEACKKSLMEDMCNGD